MGSVNRGVAFRDGRFRAVVSSLIRQPRGMHAKEERLMSRASIVGTLSFLLTSAIAHGQVDWVLFEDTISDSQCDIVNTVNSELVVLFDTGELMIVSGTDTILRDSFVALDNIVTFGVDAVGSIGFEEDGDGLRLLWWLTLDGRVVELDPFTAEPFASDLRPFDFTDVPCDACDFVDLPPAGVCFDDAPIIFDVNGGGLTLNIPMCGLSVGSIPFITTGLFGLVGLRSSRRRW
jgi:hypothetical protein